jgi:hypothetical protein
MNFLDLLNKVARFTKPSHQNLTPLQSMEEPFTETEIDSLDGLMIVMYFAIIYDIDDAVATDYHPTTPQELFDFIQVNKKRKCESIEAAMEMIK